MSNFIEELYYGNIDPQARSFAQNKNVQNLMQILTDSEVYLEKVLVGESLRQFQNFSEAISEVNNASNLDSFITGFRLGARFTLDTFIATNAPYSDIKENIL